MRTLGLLTALVALVPATASAHPAALALAVAAPEDAPATEPADTAETADTPGEPAAAEPDSDLADSPYEATSSKAPDAAEIEETPPEPEPLPQPDPVEPDEDATLEGERDKAPKKDFNKHGVGVRGGITIIPTWIFSRYLETHSNALCRGDSIGNFAERQGVLKVDGCNFFIGGQYIYRQSRILDIVGAIGYQRLKAPDGYWLDKGKFNPNDPTSLGAADYTEIDLSMMFIQADFVARYPVVVNDTVEFGIGGGAGLGLGILFGGVYQTPIGANPDGYVPGQGPTTGASCLTTSDLADFQRCTPRWDVEPDQDDIPPDPNDLSDPNAELFASCSRGNCSEGDLDAFGYRKKQDDVPPVIPVVNLILSTRIIFKDTFGITLEGGWNTGFYFGGSLNYFFGKQFQKSGRTGPAN